MKSIPFRLRAKYAPSGDQPQAIEALTQGAVNGKRSQLLYGVTGSGKTFTMANVIANTQRPALIVTHNKVLANQLYGAFQEYFPENAVRQFVSSYQKYRPESYRRTTDQYVDKFATTDDVLAQHRVKALHSLLRRRDVIVVATVSVLFGLGSRVAFERTLTPIHVGQSMSLDSLQARLTNVRYTKASKRLRPGTFRMAGNTMTVVPTFTRIGWRVTIKQESIVDIETIDTDTGETTSCGHAIFHPAFETIIPLDELEAGIDRIRREAKLCIAKFRRQGQTLAARRLAARIDADVEMMEATGYCPGMENYAKCFAGGVPGSPTETLLSHLPEGTITFIDESHVTIPQIRGMHKSDIKRKQPLVDHGFLLPSALDRRPLTLREFENRAGKIIYVSATPSPYEFAKSGDAVVEQQVRPTGLLDPEINVQPSCIAEAHLGNEILQRKAKNERALVMTTTKAAAEELAVQLQSSGIRCSWMHSDLTTEERNHRIAEIRNGACDVIVGCNLLREGLNLPMVSLVAILDADAKGFLRDETSLIQMIGRAARHPNGKAIFYANTVTGAMARAIQVTRRRRRLQEEHNRRNGVRSATVSASQLKSA